MKTIKEKYNENLQRIERAFIYFERKDVLVEQKEKQIGAFKELLQEQNELMEQLGLRAGDRMVLEGFHKMTA